MSENNRENLILNFFNRQKELSLINLNYKKLVLKFLLDLIKLDQNSGDITAQSLFNKNNIKIKAVLITRENGIIAGLKEAELLIKYFKLKYKFFKQDGEEIKASQKLLELEGYADKILLIERTLINVLARMSGVASLTNQFVAKTENKIKIAGTRKTIWNLLDKKAIIIGRGLSHRIDLSDAILIKDNHLAALNNNFKLALGLASQNKKIKFIEIEVNSENQALEAAQIINNLDSKKQYAIMLDNFSPQKIKQIILEIKKINKNILLEASGGINLANIKNYLNIGADAISIGALTKSAKSLDFSLKVS